jgi:putative acetyltransferase
MASVITAERPDSADAVALIAELETFYLLRADGVPAGCGGIQLFGTDYGELKRMYVRPPFRGSGFGELLLDRLEHHAREHGVFLVRLETGIHQTAAIRLYERKGFQRIPPFGDYFEDPLSLCYEKRLEAEPCPASVAS